MPPVQISIANDSVSIRFFYNLGIEYFKHLINVYGYGHVMAMVDGEGGAYDQNPNDLDANQMTADFQQMGLDGNETDMHQKGNVRIYLNFCRYLDLWSN